MATDIALDTTMVSYVSVLWVFVIDSEQGSIVVELYNNHAPKVYCHFPLVAEHT